MWGTMLTVYRSNWDSFLEKCAVNDEEGQAFDVITGFDAVHRVVLLEVEQAA